MSDDIHIKVAKAMGWKQWQDEASLIGPGSRPQGRYVEHWIWTPPNDHHVRSAKHEPPPFTTDAGAALTVCDYLAQGLWTQSMWRTADGQWNVVFGLGEKSGVSAADTLPMAICLAFLRTKLAATDGAHGAATASPSARKPGADE